MYSQSQRSIIISYLLLNNSIAQARRQREFIYIKTQHFKKHINQLPNPLSMKILRNVQYLTVNTNLTPDNWVS